MTSPADSLRTNSRSAGLLRRAVIDLGALTRNISALAEGRPSLSVDGRANAYGIGLDALERAATATGTRVSTAGMADLGPETFGFSAPAEDARADGRAPGLETVVTLSAEVVATKRVSAGTGVSYGYTYSTAADSNLALVCLGFADGIPRRASNHAHVTIGGRRFRAVGRIAMDQFVIDLGEDSVNLGDEVIIFGDPALGHPNITEWADAAALAPEQLSSRLGSRISFEVSDA